MRLRYLPKLVVAVLLFLLMWPLAWAVERKNGRVWDRERARARDKM